MKKHYSLLLLISFLTVNTAVNSQIRFTKVDPVTDVITIHNYGSTTVNISNYQICRKLQYKILNTLTLDSGSFMLQAGGDVVLSNATLDATSSDLGLYLNSTFTSTTSMLDFLQWGSSGNGRESVANSKGIWTTGNFISTTGPYFYNGNGTTETGVSFWSNSTLGVLDFAFSKNTFAYPNPTKNIINISSGIDQLVVKAELFDILGKRLKTKHFNELSSINSFSLENIANGIYYLQLTSSKGTVTSKKVIKN